jgi:hypothetical protein
VSNRTSKRILAVTLALLAAQLAACGGGGGGGGGNNTPPDSSAPPPGSNNPPPSGGDNNPPGGGDNNPPPSGGDNSGGNNGGTTPPPGELTSGVFIDAPVAGLSYTTSSGITDVTDADGRYDYRAGDTVTFSIGNLVLGVVPAQGVVTPMTVANALVANTSNNPETVAVNLLVLLQSLDANGNPEDGISLTPAIRAAVAANSIDLTAGDTAFTSSLSTFVSSVSGVTGLPLTPVDREDAVDHFVGQAPNALAGVYVRANANFAPITEKIVTLTMFRNGEYLLGGQYDNAECAMGDSSGTPKNSLVFSDARGNGVEYGAYDWNPLTQAFTVDSADVSIETDGFCGFNEPVIGATNDTAKLEITTQGLVFRNAAGNVIQRFARMRSERTGIAGAWVQPTALMKGQPFVFSMFPSSEDGKTGRYLMVDASLPTPDDTSPGIEEGCYSIDANNNLTVELNSSLCANAVDTNDTAGMSDSSSAQLRIDENDRLVIVEGEDVTGFARLPVEQLTIAKLAGAWIIENEPGAQLGGQENLALLTVFEDGRFLFGTQENNPSCIVGYPTPDQDANGNGLEYGTLSLTDTPGLVTPVDLDADTNGECGLYDATKEFTQRYFVVPNAAGNALVLWANDEEDPAGFVLKRVPSVSNEITGAWLWSEGVADQFAVVAYLPSGVMFEVSLFPGFSGLLRESFTMNGDVMTSHAGLYEYCVDTENDPSESNCSDMNDIVETYEVQGDTIIDDDEAGSMTRIPTYQD